MHGTVIPSLRSRTGSERKTIALLLLKNLSQERVLHIFDEFLSEGSLYTANDLPQANVHEILHYVSPGTQDNRFFEKIIGLKQFFLISFRMTICMLSLVMKGIFY